MFEAKREEDEEVPNMQEEHTNSTHSKHLLGSELKNNNHYSFSSNHITLPYSNNKVHVETLDTNLCSAPVSSFGIISDCVVGSKTNPWSNWSASFIMSLLEVIHRHTTCVGIVQKFLCRPPCNQSIVLDSIGQLRQKQAMQW
jgi:hypothetical protein